MGERIVFDLVSMECRGQSVRVLYNEWNVGDDNNEKGNDNMMVEMAMFWWRAKNQIYVFLFFFYFLH